MNTLGKNRIKNFSIIILSLTCFMFILIGVLSFIRDYSNREKFFHDVGIYYTEIIARILDEQIADVVDKTFLISQSKEVENYFDQPTSLVRKYNVNKYLRDSIEHLDEYHKIILESSENKDESIAVGDFNLDINIEEDYFLENNYFISSVYQDNDMMIQYYYIVIPIYLNDSFSGTFTVVVDISEFTDLFVSNISYRDTGYTFFIKENAELIAHPLQGKTDKYKTEIIISATDIINKYNAGTNLIKSSFNARDKYYYVREYSFSNETNSEKMLIVFCQESAEIFSELKGSIINMTVLIIAMLSIFTVIIISYSMKYKNLISKDTQFAVEETIDYEVEKQTRILKRIAETDSLTKLYNHGAMYKIISREIEQSKQEGTALSLLMLDLDYFKTVNDEYGHVIGDEVLVNVAELLNVVTRKTDIVGRYGGEEFIILLTDTNIYKGLEIAERIRKSVEEKEFTENKMKLTISIGLKQRVDEDVSELIKNTDKMLYESKAKGRNKTSF